jgi:hypothetical protein
MFWLVALAVLSLLLLGLCVGLLVHYRARVDDLQAVIRAQRRCMDQLTTGSSWADGKAKAPEWGPGRPGRYPIDPSAN